MKKILTKVILILVIAAVALMVSSEAVLGEIIEIPIDAQEMLPINEQFYVSETEYRDPSLEISIEFGRAYNTDYVVARIKIANATQLRTYDPFRYGDSQESPMRLAKHGGGVISMNGDFYRKANNELGGKYIVRQGVLRQNNPTGYFDALVIDDQGDFHIYPKAHRDVFDGFDGTIVNAFAFGPGLVIDGRKVDQFFNQGYGPTARAQRSALCQTGPLEYMIVMCAGPDNPGSTGMIIEEWADTVYSIGGVQQAYNFDGGTSACLVFRDEKVNIFGMTKYRQIADIILFASAWQDE